MYISATHLVGFAEKETYTVALPLPWALALSVHEDLSRRPRNCTVQIICSGCGNHQMKE